MRKKARKQKIQETREIQKLKRERNNMLLEKGSLFKPVYCQMLIGHCSKGYSFKSFAAQINVTPEILEEWTEKYKDFKKARALAVLKQRDFWERSAVEACMGKFSFSIFRYFTGDVEVNISNPNHIVLLPEVKEKEEAK